MEVKANLPVRKAGNRGFTMVELIIAMVISTVIMGAIFSAYKAQQTTYTAQNQVTEMQQNLRAGMDALLREIRMAGYDPSQTFITESEPGIEVASIGRFRFYRDLNGNGAVANATADPNEDITFGFGNSNDQGIVNNSGDAEKNNGVAVGGAASLGRSSYGSSTFQAIADDIAAIEFKYTLMVPTAGGTGVTEIPTTEVNSNQFQYIRKIEISLLARASYPDPKFKNKNTTYTTAAGNSWGPFNDNYRRRLLIGTVQCRNMGLK